MSYIFRFHISFSLLIFRTIYTQNSVHFCTPLYIFQCRCTYTTLFLVHIYIFVQGGVCIANGISRKESLQLPHYHRCCCIFTGIKRKREARRIAFVHPVASALLQLYTTARPNFPIQNSHSYHHVYTIPK